MSNGYDFGGDDFDEEDEAPRRRRSSDKPLGWVVVNIVCIIALIVCVGTFLFNSDSLHDSSGLTTTAGIIFPLFIVGFVMFIVSGKRSGLYDKH